MSPPPSSAIATSPPPLPRRQLINIYDPAGIRDIYNIRLERSVGSFATQRPVCRGKQFFNKSKLANRFIGNWQLFANGTMQAGLPVNVGGPDISRVPGLDPKLPLSQSIANSRYWSNACGCAKPWFNPAAFTTTSEFRIPDGPRFLPKVREGWLRSIGASLQKSLFVTERIRLSLQLRAFNMLNQLSFSGPSVITGGIVDNARRAEVGAKLHF